MKMEASCSPLQALIPRVLDASWREKGGKGRTCSLLCGRAAGEGAAKSRGWVHSEWVWLYGLGCAEFSLSSLGFASLGSWCWLMCGSIYVVLL